MDDIKAMKKVVEHLSVLIVDDEDVLREKTAIFMGKFFSEIDTAENGSVALEMFKKKNYDFVLTDIKMPKMTGWDLIKEIRNIKTDVFIVSVSGSSEVDINNNLNLSDLHFLKPLQMEHTIEIIEAIIQRNKI